MVTLDHFAVVVHEDVVSALEAEAILGIAPPAAKHHCVDGVGAAARPLQENTVLNEPDNLSAKTRTFQLIYVHVGNRK